MKEHFSASMLNIVLLALFIFCSSCNSKFKSIAEEQTLETDKEPDKLDRTGIWKFNLDNGSVRDSIVEYLKIDGKEYANQIWLVNKNNDTIGGNYFNIYLNDTTKLGDVTRIKFELIEPAISKDSDIYVLLPVDGRKLKDDFSNFFDLDLDTIQSLKNDGIPHPELTDLGLNLNHIIEFGIEYAKTGEKRVQGVISEKGIFNGKKYERRLFFNHNTYIVE